MEDRGSEREKEGERASKSESVTERYTTLVLRLLAPLFLSLLSTFLFHSPHGRRNGLCFYLLASGAALAVTGHCGWMCVRNASAWLYMSTAQHYLCFCLFIPNEVFCLGLFSALINSCALGLIKEVK